MSAYERLKEKNFMIAVPSRDRSFLAENRRGIWKHIDPWNPYPYNTYLTIREEELPAYREAYNGNIIVTDNDTNITKTRQVILEKAKHDKVEFLFMFDDDINLNYRDENLPSKYTSRQDGFEMFNHFDKCLLESLLLCSEEFPLVGLPNRQGANNRKFMFEKNTMMIRYVCYHIPTWTKENIRCDGLNGGVMEDYYVQLTLLSRGYRTLANCRYAVDDPGTGYRGGCNATRTVAVQNESAIQLSKLFPESVTLKIKEDGQQHWKEDRYDVNVRWKTYLAPGELPYVPADEAVQRFGISLTGEY